MLIQEFPEYRMYQGSSLQSGNDFDVKLIVHMENFWCSLHFTLTIDVLIHNYTV